MHLRRASEIFIDESHRLPDILVGGGQPGECALSAAGGGRTVASLVTRHLVGALEERCRAALRACLADSDSAPRTTMLRLDRIATATATATATAREHRLTAWVERIGDDAVVFSARASADDSGSNCEVTIAFAIGRGDAAGRRCTIASVPEVAAATATAVAAWVDTAERHALAL